MKLWCFVTGNVFLLQDLKKGLMSASGNSSNLIPVVHCMLFFIVILLYSGLKKRCNILFHFWNKDGFSNIFDRLLTCSFKMFFFFFFQMEMSWIIYYSDLIGFRGMLQIAFLPLLPCKTMYICSYIWLLI